MIKIYTNIERLANELSKAYNQRAFERYKLILDSNNQITVYLKDIHLANKVEEIRDEWNNVSFECLDADDDSYDFMFEDGNGVDIHSSRLRLSNLLTTDCKRKTVGIPVITFYSYKGGVGRSTALASLASYLSIKKGMKVCVLDCDFEAPGFTNFFLEDPDNIYYKNGLVEYFMDCSTGDAENLSSYYHEASKKFSGNGMIYIFSSGNLSDETVGEKTHLDHYLDGLSRLDTFHPDTLVEEFEKLFQNIKEELKPDVILMDSRTGFNDIFGISAFRLSDIVIGLFGIDAQSKPGLSFFIKTLNRSNCPRVILANSIIPSFAKTRLFSNFKTYTEDILAGFQTEEDERESGIMEIKTFPIGYNEILRNIGLPTSSFEDYISMIENNEFSDYNNLFSYILECIGDISHLDIKSNGKEETVTINESRTEPNKNEVLALKKVVLDNVVHNIPQLYAESIQNFEDEYKQNRYFYRHCMEDLFNADKFLVLGNKGTGKTYIYRSLANNNIVETLRQRANKQAIDYEFVQIINSEHQIDTQQLDNMVGDFSSDLFFERFWKIYIWNVILSSYSSILNAKDRLFPINNDTATALKFTECIKDDNFIVQIENDLATLDRALKGDKSKNRRLVFIFDELDNVVKPHLWTERVSPLINYCRRMQYACISPKLFLRSDLFNKTANINNRNELNNRTIYIEWQKDELFAYFFKFILSHSKYEFFKLMKTYGYYPSSYINKTIQKITKEGDQPSPDEYTLRHLCATFFGKYADSQQSTRYGESYDWFFNNLQNADGTISLRPFIDLIRFAVNDAIGDDSSECPILPAKYFTNSNVRVKAVEKHFCDLAGEKGNTDLKYIFEFIRQLDKNNRKYKRDMLPIDKFTKMAQLILSTGKLEDTSDVDSMINLLIVNGIVRERFIRLASGSVRCIQFALLYKYYLGLGSRKHKTDISH